MKINIKRTADVADYMLVQFAGAGLVEPMSDGTFAGIVADCREIIVSEEGVETADQICTLITHGSALAKLSGAVDQNGGAAYVNGTLVSSSGTVKIGLIAPRPYPESSDYADGDLVSVVLS